MTMRALTLLLWTAAPFWETVPPEQWSIDQLKEMLTDSPWARKAGVPVFLATAKPMQEAERQWRIRTIPKDVLRQADEENDYQELLRDSPGKYIVLAVVVSNLKRLAEAKEIAEMEANCYLRVGRQKIQMVGHFPPNSTDPFLRLVFPRPENVEKSLRFDLYLPTGSSPYQQVEFSLNEMRYKGKIEY